ncbi:MAG: M12 family metallo-peptidase [Thermodesulfobacteriota bacterium]
MSRAMKSGVLLWVLIATVWAPLAQAGAPLAIRPAAGRQPMGHDRSALAVQVDLGLLGAVDGPVLVGAALPERQVVCRRQRLVLRGEGDFSWFGSVEGEAGSSVVLTAVDGILMGQVVLGQRAYAVEPVAGGYLALPRDPGAVPPFADDARLPPGQPPPPARQRQAAAVDDGSVLDLLVLYTPAMASRYGSTLGTVIQHQVDVANTCYTNSQIATRLRLAGTARYDLAAAREGIAGASALDALTDDSTAATLRNTYGADLVSLLRVYAGSGGCGYGWIMTPEWLGAQFATLAFSVVEVRLQSEGTGYYCLETSLAHELGHNLGCAHDRDHASGSGGAYAYSYGYDVPGILATVMSYDTPGIPYFSNPNISYRGYATGVAAGRSDAADNARTINSTRTIVAAFRPGIAQPPQPDVKANGQDGPLAVGAGSPVAVTVVLAANDGAGQTADWYIVRQTPASPLSSLVLSGAWRSGFRRLLRYPLLDVATTTIFQDTLPAGSSFFHFAVVSGGEAQVDTVAVEVR